MKTVGIKELKNNLSRYLRAVRSGATVLVTDRDEVIAEIRQPTNPEVRKISRWERWLNAQEKSGGIRRATPGGPSLAKAWKLPKPPVPLNLRELLEECRTDRS